MLKGPVIVGDFHNQIRSARRWGVIITSRKFVRVIIEIYRKMCSQYSVMIMQDLAWVTETGAGWGGG